MTATIIIAAVAAVIAIIAAWMLGGNKVKAEYQQKISALEGELIRKEAEANSEKQLRESEKKNHEESFKSLKEAQEQALAATKAQLVTESERQMKQREESLKQEAAEAIKNITGDLNKDIKAMTEAFEKQKEAQNTAKAEIKTQFDETVKHLKEQTESIGNTADNLAQALKGKNKMQGIFGETILGNILKAEGLVEGRDYESEVTLRDSKGRTIKNENSGSKMRPDFVLHYPNGIDALLDSKVSLSALSDYFAAESDEQREDAAKRNLASVWKHVEELAGKEYQRYVVGLGDNVHPQLRGVSARQDEEREYLLRGPSEEGSHHHRGNAHPLPHPHSQRSPAEGADGECGEDYAGRARRGGESGHLLQVPDCAGRQD